MLISLDKCNGSCNVLPPQICVPKETKDINVKVFNMITNKNESKPMAKHISCNCKCRFNSTTCNSTLAIQDSVWKACHDLTTLCLNISHTAIFTAKNVDYCCIIHNISKSEAINLLENSVLENCRCI